MRLPTASKLDLFKACGGPWRLPLARTETSRAASKGRSLHKFAETGASQSVKGVKTQAEESVERALEDLPAWGELSMVAQRECVLRYNPRTGKCEILGVSGIARPYGDEDTEWIWGTADLVGQVGDALLVADLKTGSPAWLKMPWGVRGTIDEAPLQVPFLAAVINAVLGLPSAILGIVSSQCERAFTAEYSRADLASVLGSVSEMVRNPPATLIPGDYCTFCPVRGNCPLWQS